MNQFQLGERVERLLYFGNGKIRSNMTGVIVVAWLEDGEPHYVVRMENMTRLLRICKHDELVIAQPMQLELFPKE